LRQKIQTEEEAFGFFRQGLEKGLNYYFATYDSALLYFSSRITQDEAAAEDIVSEAFVKLWQYRESILHSKAVKAYLYQVVRNASVDYLRCKKREQRHLQNIVHLQLVLETDLVAFEISAETHRLIHSSIENLPPRCGLVFRKYYIEQKTLPQIAAELGVSPNTVRNQKAQALAILRKSFLVLAFLLHQAFCNCT
jgi:RNA polymerase sigma-70 factor (family 1)